MRALRFLSTSIVVLAVVAGLIHLYLVFMMSLGPHSGPPTGGGAPPSGAGATAHSGSLAGGGVAGGLMSMLPVLFGLNFVGFTALAGLFVLVRQAAVKVRVGVDALLGLMAVATLIGWDMFGRNNPHGLGTLGLIVELALIVAVVAHGFSLRQRAILGIAPGPLSNGTTAALSNRPGAGRMPTRSSL